MRKNLNEKIECRVKCDDTFYILTSLQWRNVCNHCRTPLTLAHTCIIDDAILQIENCTLFHLNQCSLWCVCARHGHVVYNTITVSKATPLQGYSLFSLSVGRMCPINKFLTLWTNQIQLVNRQFLNDAKWLEVVFIDLEHVCRVHFATTRRHCALIIDSVLNSFVQHPAGFHFDYKYISGALTIAIIRNESTLTI